MKIALHFFLLLFTSGLIAQGSGEVIITEYFNRPAKPSQEVLDAALANNPDGADTSPNEGHTEWFEIYNTTEEPVVMDGWTLTDASSSSNVSTIGSFTIDAKSYAVFAGFNIPDAHGGVVFDYFYDYKKPSFNNESSYADEGDTSCPDGVIISKEDGSLVDEVRYDYGYGEYIGNEDAGSSCRDNTEALGIPASGSSSKISFSLNNDPAVMNAADNDIASNWFFSSNTYDEDNNQSGTPGLENDGTGPPVVVETGSGEVIITEYYNRPLKPSQEQLDAALANNPAGADDTPNEGHTEWFEVYNTTSEPVIMDGWSLTDASSSSNFSTIGSFTLAPFSYAVFSGFNIPEAQGGVEFDYFYDYKKPSFNNESSYADEGDTSCPDGVIITKADGSLVDEVRYDYGYGEYLGNEDAGSCRDNTAAIGIPAAGSSSKVSFMLNVDPAVMNAAANDIAENWTFSTLLYDEAGSQVGTPGVSNDGTIPEPKDFGSGEIIITEYYNRPLKPSQEQLDAALANNPAGADDTPNEGHTEWFEVYNTTSEPVVMDGWTLTDASSSSNSSTIGSFTLAPFTYAVFSGFNIPEAQGGVEFDYFYDYKKPSFNNESSYADEGDTSCPDGVIITKADGSLVDEVRYDYGYGEYLGNEDAGSCKDNLAAIGIPAAGSSSKVSFMLNVDPTVMNAEANDKAENWTFSTLLYDEAGSQAGTPGVANDGTIPEPKDFGTGEIIITEYYNRPLKPSQEQLDAALANNPAGADDTPNEGHTEWFEVYNTTSEPVVMDGWTLTDASSSSNSSTIGSFTLEANSYAVFSGFNIPEAQGGFQFDYFYDYKKPSFNNESSYADDGDTSCPDGVIIQKADGTLVDEVRYDYGYGEYLGNEDSGSCKDNDAAIGIPAAGSSSRVSFMLNVDPAVMNAEANDEAGNWTFSTATYDFEGNQSGTPGLKNDAIITSNENVLLAQHINVFPNPANTHINVVSDLDGEMEIEIYNIAGQKMNQLDFSSRSINVSLLPIGIYMVKIYIAESNVTKKISILR